MFRRCEMRFRISPGFCLLLFWFGTVNGWRLLGTILLAAAVHELGHCLVLRLAGARITGLRIGVLGAVLETDSSRLSYARELLAALAGPGANLTAAWLLGRVPGASAASGAHLVLVLFNLLPVRPLLIQIRHNLSQTVYSSILDNHWQAPSHFPLVL